MEPALAQAPTTAEEQAVPTADEAAAEETMTTLEHEMTDAQVVISQAADLSPSSPSLYCQLSMPRAPLIVCCSDDRNDRSSSSC